MRAVVKKIYRLDGKGNLKAFVTVELGPWTVHSCRIIQQLGQRPYVALPQVETPDGRFFPALSAPGLREVIQEAVLKAWKEEQQTE
jgi:DNA-binding cell septation regulator SpoVG